MTEKSDGWTTWVPDPLSESEQHEFEQLRHIVDNLSDVNVKAGGTQIMVSTDPITNSLHDRLVRLKRRIGT